MSDNINIKSDHKDRSEQRRLELLEAALHAIAKRGLTGTTINDIAKEAGVSYGVIAFHYRNKERMLLAALDHLVSKYEAICARALARTAPDPASQLIALIAVDFDQRVATAKYLAVWMAFWAESGRVAPYRRRLSELKAHSRARLTEMVEAIAARRGCTLDARTIAETLYLLTDGAWLNLHVTGQNTPRTRARAQARCLSYLASHFPEEFTAAATAALTLAGPEEEDNA